MSLSIKELRMKISDDQMLDILGDMGIEKASETNNAIIFPTACHNESGGSHKLYYYRKDKIFKCYTECNTTFDLFELIKKVKDLRGEEVTIGDAIKYTGVEDNGFSKHSDLFDDLAYLKKKSNALSAPEQVEVEILDKALIDRFPFCSTGNGPWISEGISIHAMQKFKIGYSKYHKAITIPNLNHEGELVGIRGRFFDPNAKGKYMPIMIEDKKILSHPTGKYLYGYYENKQSIKNAGIVVIFEGEKSVLKMETYYPNNNVSLSTSGKKITVEHLHALLKLGVPEVVLAYDKDYTTPEERNSKYEEYEKVTNLLLPYFNVSIIMDTEDLLQLKDSPADQGQEIFEKLIQNRKKR